MNKQPFHLSELTLSVNHAVAKLNGEVKGQGEIESASPDPSGKVSAIFFRTHDIFQIIEFSLILSLESRILDWSQKERILQSCKRWVLVLSSGQININLDERVVAASHYEEVKYRMKQQGTQELALVSYLRLRRIVGILGVALPIVLMVWGFALSGWSIEFQNSISDYYSLRTRDALVGILFAIAWFLCTYKGYETIDDIAGYVACLFALGVAFFPNSGGNWERIVHFSSAAGLFLTLSFFSLFLFTKTVESPKGLHGTLSSFRFGVIKSSDPRKSQKKIRNRVYVVWVWLCWHAWC